MKITKRAAVLLLSFILLIASCPMSAFALVSGEFEYTLTSEGEALITGYSGTATDVAIPETVTTAGNQYVVRSASLSIFDSVDIERLTVPKSVVLLTDIYHLNLYHTSLREIRVAVENTSYVSENGVLFDKEMKTLYAYPNAKTATSYSVADTVEAIDSYAFYGADKLSFVTLADSVKTIGMSAFSQCTALRTVSLGSGVQTISASAFNGCASLQSVDIPQTVTQIGVAAFRNCPSLTAINVAAENANYTSENGVLFSTYSTGVKYELIAYPASKTDKAYRVPDSVIVIASYAFAGAKNLESVDTGASVIDIRSYAFSDCTALGSVTFGASLSNIGNCAFLNCPSLKGVKIGRNVNTVGSHALGYCYLPDSDEYRRYDDFTITTPANTAAYQYAYNNGITIITEGECAHTYSYVYDTIAPTCTEQGYTEYACTYCGAHFRKTYVAPLGHSEGDWIVDKNATYTSKGKRHKVCRRCGKISTVGEIPMKKRNISACKITLKPKAVTATGKPVKPAVTVTFNGKKLKNGTDYKLTFAKNVSPGIATVTVRGAGEHFTSSKTLKFKVKPTKVTGFKVAGKSATSVKLKWKKKGGISGYRIYMYNTKTKKYQLVKTMRGAKKTSVTISKTPTGAPLRNGGSYKFKICAYKIVNSSTTVSSDKTTLNYKK